MKKLLFIASVGLLFSCNNGGTCVCTTTYTGSYAQSYLGSDPYIEVGETYYDHDAQEYCDANQSNADNYDNNYNAQTGGVDIFRSTSCVVE